MNFDTNQLLREELDRAALQEGIKYRAQKMAVATGNMPEVEFIWEMQLSEGGPACFGQGHGCENRDCHWREQCLALDQFEDIM